MLKNSMLLKRLISQFFIVLVVFFYVPATVSLAQPNTGQSIVRISIIYDDTCLEDCQIFLNQTLPQLQSEYKEQLEIVVINITEPENQAVQRALFAEYTLPETIPYPILFMNQEAVIGLPDIESNIRTLIDDALLEGEAVYFPNPIITWLTHQQQELNDKLSIERQTTETLSRQISTQQDKIESQQLWLAGLALMLFISLVFTGIIFRLYRSTKYQLRESKRALNKAESEKQEMVSTLLGQSSGNHINFLSVLGQIDYEFQNTKKISPKAAYLARDFLKVMADSFNMKPVAPYAQQVPFDPSRHRSYESHEKEELVWVIDPGWQKNGVILQYALVQSEFEAL